MGAGMFGPLVNILSVDVGGLYIPLSPLIKQDFLQESNFFHEFKSTFNIVRYA